MRGRNVPRSPREPDISDHVRSCQNWMRVAVRECFNCFDLAVRCCNCIVVGGGRVDRKLGEYWRYM